MDFGLNWTASPALCRFRHQIKLAIDGRLCQDAETAAA